MNRRSPAALVFQGLFLVGLLAICGCGKAEYERRVLANMIAANDPLALGAASKIQGTELMIRLPQSINSNARAYVEGSTEPNSPAIVNPDRLNPPFMKIPGQRICYEVPLLKPDDKENIAPLLWYLGVLSPQDPLPNGKPIDQYAMETLGAAFKPPDQPPTSDTVVVNGAQWQRVTEVAMQKFIGVDGSIHNEVATFQLLTGDVGGSRVVVAFRAPSTFLQQTRAVDLLPLVAATIAPPGAPAPAAPAAAPAQ
ncbi:MAG TPA: hypothetical protein VGJ26_05460 [Pirellulales bacterium]